MSETLGSLMDKLIIVNLKIWHAEDLAHATGAKDKQVADAKRKINVLNNQRNDLIEEIDELILDIVSGRKKPKVYRQFKDYGHRK